MKIDAYKKPKIAVLMRKYVRHAGGSQGYCVELTEKLSELFEVHVYCHEYVEISKNITFHKLPIIFKKPSFVNQLIFSYLTKKKTKGKYDIVHSHETVTHADIYTLHVPCIKTQWMESNRNKKALYILDTITSPRIMFYLWLEFKKFQHKPGKYFIAVSKLLESNIINCYPEIESHIGISYPGINIKNLSNDKNKLKTKEKFIKKIKISGNSFILLFVAHSFKRKGLQTVINALEILNNKNIYLVVAGGGNKEEVVINSNIVSSNIRYIGTVEKMNDIYQSANALVHPTTGDTFGMVAAEAMSNKLPVIISSKKYCGYSEVLDTDDAIIINDPLNKTEIAEAIDTLYNSDNLARKISLNGCKKVANYTWNQTAENTITAYKKLL